MRRKSKFKPIKTFFMVVPLAIMLGVSYLLRRLGWITEPPAPPSNGATDPTAPKRTEAHPEHSRRSPP